MRFPNGRCSLSRIWTALLTLVLGVILPLGSAQAWSVIVLDPGHGGSEAGAAWYGIREKNLTLDVAKRVDTILRKNGVTTVMTRRTDKTVSLASRYQLANRYRKPLFVSIHFNACSNRSATGYETFYCSSSGRKVALTIQKALSQKLRGPNRGVSSCRFAVVRHTDNTAVLVECGFISNKTEAARCNTSAYKQKIAEGIANGILRANRR